MVRTFFMAAVAGALLAPAAPVSAQTAGPKPWDSAVRCAVLGERMPEVIDASLRVLRATPLTGEGVTPEMRQMMKAAEQMMVASRPVMVEMAPLLRDGAKEAVEKAYPSSAAYAASLGARSSDQLLELELAARRREYAAVRLNGAADQVDLALKSLNAEMKRHCTPEAAR